MKKGFDDDILKKKGWVWNGSCYVPADKGVNKVMQKSFAKVMGENISIGFNYLDMSGNTVQVEMKPMSVNKAWQGRRFKTPEYLAYEKAVLGMLPKYELPEAPYKFELTLGVSSKLSDIDNPVKLILDILQKAYGFNDKLIFEMVVRKHLTVKRKEFFRFSITSMK